MKNSHPRPLTPPTRQAQASSDGACRMAIGNPARAAFLSWDKRLVGFPFPSVWIVPSYLMHTSIAAQHSYSGEKLVMTGRYLSITE